VPCNPCNHTYTRGCKSWCTCVGTPSLLHHATSVLHSSVLQVYRYTGIYFSCYITTRSSSMLSHPLYRYKILKMPPNPVVVDRPDYPPLSNPSFAVLVGKALGIGELRVCVCAWVHGCMSLCVYACMHA
jgi:hypothetical protein